MSDAVINTIADAVVQELNENLGGWGLTQVVARRKTQPRFDVSELEKPKVTVAPSGTQWKRITRGKKGADRTIEVGIQQHTKGSDAKENLLLRVADLVGDHFYSARLKYLPAATCSEVTAQQGFLATNNNEFDVFTIVLSLKVEWEGSPT